jgi:pSer/pThr/pTyr-binding forkhead associated (FHA) protein
MDNVVLVDLSAGCDQNPCLSAECRLDLTGEFAVRIQILTGPEGRLKAFRSLDFPDGQIIVIGRGVDCDVVIEDNQSSRRHAQVVWANSVAYIEDMDSKNGTALNGKPVHRRALRNGDQVQIGSTLLTVTRLPDNEGQTTYAQIQEDPPDVLLTMEQDKAIYPVNRPAAPAQGESQRENEMLMELARISHTVVTTPDTDLAILNALDSLHNLLAADTACFLMRDPIRDDWRVVMVSRRTPSDRPITVSRTIIGQAIREGQAIVTADAMSDSRFSPSSSIVVEGVSSAVCAPIRIGGGFGGVLFLDRRHREEAFGPVDLRVVATVASMMSLLLEKERLAIEARQAMSTGKAGS